MVRSLETSYIPSCGILAFGLCFQVVSMFLSISSGNSRSFHSQSHKALWLGNVLWQ